MSTLTHIFPVLEEGFTNIVASTDFMSTTTHSQNATAGASRETYSFAGVRTIEPVVEGCDVFLDFA